MRTYFNKKKKKGLVKKLYQSLTAYKAEPTTAKIQLILPTIDLINTTLNYDVPSDVDIPYLLTLEIYGGDTCSFLIDLLPFFDQMTINAVSTLFRATVRKFPNESLPSYLMKNEKVFRKLTTYFDFQVLSEISHLLVRSCLANRNFTQYIFDTGIFSSFHQYLVTDDFDRVATAFATFDSLIHTHPDLSCEFLIANWEINSFIFKHLLNSSRNYVSQSTAVIFYKLLLSSTGRKIFHKFIGDTDFLVLSLKMMKHPSKKHQNYGYGFFKIFILNPRIPKHIFTILLDNKYKLIHYLRGYKLDPSTVDLENEKGHVLEKIENLFQ